MRVMRCVTNKKIRGEDEDERMEHATDGFSGLNLHNKQNNQISINRESLLETSGLGLFKEATSSRLDKHDKSVFYGLTGCLL